MTNRILQQLDDICSGKWAFSDYVSPYSAPKEREYRIKYWTFEKPSVMSQHFVVAVDSISAEQKFWDEVRVTDDAPLQFASIIESIREV